jgi:hypothetical protein
MNKINLFYGKGSGYESLIKRANQSYSSNNLKDDCRKEYYELLYCIKYNNFKVKGVHTYDKIFIKVKKNLNDSISKLKKRVVETEIKEELEVFQIQILNTNELDKIEHLIKSVLDLTFIY